MKLNSEQIERIECDLKAEGIQSQELRESLLDHICCQVEGSESGTFEEAYHQAILCFGPDGIRQVEKETYRLLNHKYLIMKNTMYLTGYLAAFLSTTGILFKIQHWPGAVVMLTLGIALFNLAFLPLYFYHRKKQVAR